MNVLAKDKNKTQLAGQLFGRLLSSEINNQNPEIQNLEIQNLEIQNLLEQAKNNQTSPWLRPLTPNLTPAGGRCIGKGAFFAFRRGVMGNWRYAQVKSQKSKVKSPGLTHGQCIYVITT